MNEVTNNLGKSRISRDQFFASPSGDSMTLDAEWERPRVLVALPAYNEAVGLSAMLVDLQRCLANAEIDYTIIVVDDGSVDETAEVVRSAASESSRVQLVQHVVNQGLAAAIRTGLMTAAEQAGKDDLIITMDSDNTHPIGLIPRMIQSISEGNDVVIASRFRPGARVIGVPWVRQLTSIVGSAMFKMLFPISGVRDYTCGFRAYRGSVIHDAFSRYGDNFISEEGFSCMVDILLKLSPTQPIMNEVPMVLRYDLKHGLSKMNVGSTIADTLRLALSRRMGNYGPRKPR